MKVYFSIKLKSIVDNSGNVTLYKIKYYCYRNIGHFAINNTHTPKNIITRNKSIITNFITNDTLLFKVLKTSTINKIQTRVNSDICVIHSLHIKKDEYELINNHSHSAIISVIERNEDLMFDMFLATKKYPRDLNFKQSVESVGSPYFHIFTRTVSNPFTKEERNSLKKHLIKNF